ncbi:hypothetical protein AVEN_153453-1 [Araneus ventricosus]|uniref:Uncharacterized protein n=1 Tax=Araneus ventricosus TaxID=182803 RepID=A0A4Y2W6P2_ARAVE|nr:hypothetical protein AVEN_153453-1 [Araneus ventricosus]
MGVCNNQKPGSLRPTVASGKLNDRRCNSSSTEAEDLMAITGHGPTPPVGVSESLTHNSPISHNRCHREYTDEKPSDKEEGSRFPGHRNGEAPGPPTSDSTFLLREG